MWIGVSVDNRDYTFRFKQWGGFNRKRAGRLLEGLTRDATHLLLAAPACEW